MDAFGFTDLLGPGPARRVRAKVELLPASEGGGDVSPEFPYRPNHNFGTADAREFYIGQVEVPAGGLRAGQTYSVDVTFLDGRGLGGLLKVGSSWRIQHGPKLVARAEVIELCDEV